MRKSPKKNGLLTNFQKNTIPFSHLLFADDILIFCKATQKSNTVLSGLSINLEKSRIWTSKKVNDQTKNYLQNNINIRISNDLGLDLGYPLKHSYKLRDFNFITEIIEKKKITRMEIEPSFKSGKSGTN